VELVSVPAISANAFFCGRRYARFVEENESVRNDSSGISED
jgi:hypothetical protein